MDFIKKNLVFCLTLFILLLVFAAGAYMAYAATDGVKSAERKAKNAESQLNGLLASSPALTADNVAASEKNVEELKAQLASIRENLQKGSRINTSSDGVAVMAGIQQFISEYQRRVQEVVDQDGEPAPISTPSKFAFGFDQYIEQGEPPADPEVASTMDKQRQILSYIVNQLIETQPASIEAVEREVLEASGDQKKGSTFSISDAVSARVPGAIDTMAFSVTFTGYTGSLRSFLNNLAEFDLPIVVRSIEVERPQDSATTDTNAVDGLFGAFGVEAPTSSESVEQQKPVITDNVSRYTVVLEFIDIVLPQEAEQNPS